MLYFTLSLTPTPTLETVCINQRGCLVSVRLSPHSHSHSINWLAGFFGVESWQEESHLSIMHEASGYNNTLAPWEICPREDSYQSKAHVGKWRNKYLRNALKRLNKLAFGYEFEIGDVFAMQVSVLSSFQIATDVIFVVDIDRNCVLVGG